MDTFLYAMVFFLLSCEFQRSKNETNNEKHRKNRDFSFKAFFGMSVILGCFAALELLVKIYELTEKYII